jgi:hypothetical protein
VLHKKKEQTEFADGSEPLFFMYQKMTEEEDNKVAEVWQKVADGIIIFVSPLAFFTSLHTPRKIHSTGLFSAAVAALAAVSVVDLQPNSQDTSAFLSQEDV